MRASARNFAVEKPPISDKEALMSDVEAVSQVVLFERQGRDRGWWEQMAATFHPDSRVRLSWIDSTGADFVAGSREVSARGILPTHRVSPPVVHVNGDKAIADLAATIQLRFVLHGVSADLDAFVRLVYRVQRFDDRWLIVQLDCIYEHDTLNPTIPGEVIPIDQEVLSSLRPAYKFLAYHQGEDGHVTPPDLYGDDQPERIAEFYVSASDWLGLPLR